MVTVEIIRCQGCGANLSPNNTTCEYCGSINVIKSKENPFSLDESLTKKYVNFYKDKVKAEPSDGEAVFALGLFYLRLKLYDLAIKNFANAIEIMPDESDVYYYYSLSLLKGRRPKTMTLSEVKKIEEYLNTAIQLNDKTAYYTFLAALKYDFYKQNGFKVTNPNYFELLDKAQSISSFDSNEFSILKEHLILRDGPVYEFISSN